MPDNTLKQKAVKGIIWSAVERFSVQGVSFLFMLVMARLLTPEDYGLIGMLSIFLAVAQSLIDSGFSQALIRKQNRTAVDESTVFYFNIAVSIALYFILFFSAPLVADFYKMPELKAVMQVSSLVVVINSLAVVQRAQFTIKVDFKNQAKASLIAAIISGSAGITLAYLGFSYWALVIQSLVSAAINTLVLWILSKWRPIRAYSWTSFRELFSFGSKLLFSGLLDTIYNNLYPIIIGKKFSAASLGHYSRAQHFSSLPSSNITGILQRVTFPILCQIQDDDARLADVYRRFLKLSAFIIFPLMIGLSAVSHPFVSVVIGPKWDYAALLLQIICFQMMWYPIHAINLNLLQVKGRSDLFLRLEIIKKIIGVTMLCITVPIGLEAMCYGGIVSSIICLVINTYYTGKLIHVGFIRQMIDLCPTLLLSLFMFVSVIYGIKLVENIYIQLTLGILIGSIIFLGGSYLLRFKELHEIRLLIKR